ncbi:hypothetical protein [Nocardia sp. BMG111209]|uniref:hypothetical protein n=1 Tax=Nocardia sp. BMG111209 TaxID=1160137 RepID=UPI0003770182|nr:hypothetical protein [Nocardia sp. BMG111209]
MNDRIDHEDAVRALDEIGRRREQAIRRKVFPGWYWWAHAALIVAFTAAIESGRTVLLAIGIAGYALAALIIDRPVSRAARAAPLRRGPDGPRVMRRTLIGLAAFVAALIGALSATAFGLKAAGIPCPATIAAAVTAVVFAIGGRLLVRYEQTVLTRSRP